MGGSNQPAPGTHVSQLPHTVECVDCGKDIREATARGHWDTGYYCRDCDDSETDLMLHLFPLEEDEE